MMKRSSGAAAPSQPPSSLLHQHHQQQQQQPQQQQPSDAAVFLQSLQDPEIIERVRATIQNAHVFKLPPKHSASVGWRGADWKEKVWQGTVKVVERGDLTAVLLVDDKSGQNHHTNHRSGGSIFAVCPIKEGAVDRCIDSSRYFVLRIENANGRHMFIGVAFNERNDSFDFYTALEDSRREKEQEKNPVVLDAGPPKDYSIKDGQKIRVSIPKTSGRSSRESRKHSSSLSSGTKNFLQPSSRDTPSRPAPDKPSLAPPQQPSPQSLPSSSSGKPQLSNFLDDPFASEGFDTSNSFFSGKNSSDDQSTGSGNPFFNKGDNSNSFFDPRQYKTEQGR